MKIDRIELHQIEQTLVTPFETSFGRATSRAGLLVSLHAEGLTGWGECPASHAPFFSHETVTTAWHVLGDVLIPWVCDALRDGTVRLDASTHETGTGLDSLLAFLHQLPIRGHQMARAALENAFWDIFATVANTPLAQMLGGSRHHVPVGISLGIEPTPQALMHRIEHAIADGYQRIKLKIKPGWDVAIVREVRERWPDIVLQVDANAAYSRADSATLRELDQFGLLLIEQPFHYDDLLDHAWLQGQIQTPICLDESIQSPEHARWALELDACGVVNIKVSRVGGLAAACQIHHLCAQHNIPVWCGGMLETNIGRATNVALASLPNFSMPGDMSASARYYQHDIAQPDFVLNEDSTLSVPASAGLGVHIIPERLAAARTRHQVFACC